MPKITMFNYGRVMALALVFLALGACSGLHDGEGFEHKPGEPGIQHKH